MFSSAVMTYNFAAPSGNVAGMAKLYDPAPRVTCATSSRPLAKLDKSAQQELSRILPLPKPAVDCQKTVCAWPRVQVVSDVGLVIVMVPVALIIEKGLSLSSKPS